MNSSHTGLVVWFTGLSSAGKTTLAEATQLELQKSGREVEVLDGDVVRRTLSRDLSFTRKDREENIRRISFIAASLEQNGIIVLVAAMSPFRQGRDDARAACRNFIEVYVNAPLIVCEQRDTKGIYRKARTGELADVIGVHEPYEAPFPADVECRTHEETVSASLVKILQAINKRLRHSAFLSHANR
jgi:adenylylsulfate kinase